MKGTVDKFLGLMKLNDEEYEEYDELEEEYEEEEAYEEEEEKEKKPFFSFRKKEADPELEEPDDEPAPVKREFSMMTAGSAAAKPKAKGKVVSMNGREPEIKVIKPADFSESKTVADMLVAGKTVVINMEDIKNPEAQRTIDFIGGACYAVDGTLQAVSDHIFIAAPADTEVNGDFRLEIMNDGIIAPKIYE